MLALIQQSEQLRRLHPPSVVAAERCLRQVQADMRTRREFRNRAAAPPEDGTPGGGVTPPTAGAGFLLGLESFSGLPLETELWLLLGLTLLGLLLPAKAEAPLRVPSAGVFPGWGPLLVQILLWGGYLGLVSGWTLPPYPGELPPLLGLLPFGKREPFVLEPPGPFTPRWLRSGWAEEFPPGGPQQRWWWVEEGELEPFITLAILYSATLLNWHHSPPSAERDRLRLRLEVLEGCGEEQGIPVVPPHLRGALQEEVLSYLNALWRWRPVEEEELVLAQKALRRARMDEDPDG